MAVWDQDARVAGAGLGGGGSRDCGALGARHRECGRRVWHDVGWLFLTRNDRPVQHSQKHRHTAACLGTGNRHISDTQISLVF